jgi:hypothetical protein
VTEPAARTPLSADGTKAVRADEASGRAVVAGAGELACAREALGGGAVLVAAAGAVVAALRAGVVPVAAGGVALRVVWPAGGVDGAVVRGDVAPAGVVGRAVVPAGG